MATHRTRWTAEVAAAALLAAVAALVGPVAAARAQATSAPNPVPSFARDGVVTACFDPTFPPMEFMERPGAERPSGFDVEMVDALARLWDARVTIVVSEFTGLLPGLESGRCDMIASGATVTEARTQRFDAVPYLATAFVWMTRANAPPINEPADLGGRTVAVQAGTNFVDRVNALNAELRAAGRAPLTLQTYPSGTDVAQQVLLGRAAAAMTLDTEVAWREVEQAGQFRVAYRYPATDRFGIYLRRAEGDRAAVAAAVAALRSDGTLARIATRWRLDPAAVQAAAE